MKRIGIISDTHSHWDDRYATYFAGCQEIWHAGDVGDITILERLSEIAPVRAVSGNVDHGEVRRRCPEVDIFQCEGVKVMLRHIGGYPGKWAPGVKKTLKEDGIKLAVCGHSHILKVIYDRELDLLHINPGAAGLQGWQQVRTLIKLTIDGTDMRDCEIIELGKKGRSPS